VRQGQRRTDTIRSHSHVALIERLIRHEVTSVSGDRGKLDTQRVVLTCHSPQADHSVSMPCRMGELLA
jgi:hypothetical protein